MKSTELRIGNLTTVGRVIEIHEDYFYVHDGESSLKSSWFNIQPIPLNEEWLLRFGFKQLDKYTWLKNGWFVYNRKRGFVTGSKKREIKLSFVHTLQNWYYLTGKELTLKP